MNPGRRTRRTVEQVRSALDEIAPPQLAQGWDNVGLLAGDPKAACTGVVLCIDLTETVLAETQRRNVNLIAAYHPPIFKPISHLVAHRDEQESVVFGAIARGIAVYAMHTALDAAEGGANDVLAGLCGMVEAKPFAPAALERDRRKVVVFVPAEHVDAVAHAAFRAGGGLIGEYRCCSFRSQGEGTFLGGEGAHPTVGRVGRLERVGEVRLEFVVAADRVTVAVEAVRARHPYEEPAIDVYPLEPLARPVGMGRAGRLTQPTSLKDLAKRLAQATGAETVQIVGRPNRKVGSVAVCVGAAGRLPLESEAARCCDVVVTGEIRHHDALAIQRAGMAAIALGHWASERPALASVSRRLRGRLPALPVHISRADRCPFRQP
ncbi:MAG TPA: Nif3-like dinuclear metal center hexameric protein [Phycisphaerae bacterium]|nr:Nif3-like dinuclear metal center hexameric protein [Phycisphaerae bacterium]